MDLLALDAAWFVYGFLLASANRVSPKDRTIRNDLKEAILEVLASHGINQKTFVVYPEIHPDPAQGHS